MATAQTLAAVNIPGIHHLPTVEDFADSQNVSSGFPKPDDQLELSNTTLKISGKLFMRNDVHDVFSIHLLHIHSKVPEGKFLYGIQVPPVSVEELATGPIHSHVFQLLPNGAFMPYEFQEGEAPSKAVKIPSLLDSSKDRTNTELLVGPKSALIMDTNDVFGFNPAQVTTGWFFQVEKDEIISCKGCDVYAPKNSTYEVFQD
ncbi:hypothetical protein B0J13DRAFT_581773 [Dactylonectria estremocensis]|uniref:Uncharacterized protein n=1 Tax=Dactylonectria estremocensis TaxID=1079267 RepID=A0A9P9FCA5_9HYPO|nr:hypothetical protein B0J13DRAFT_581773 [Dactylonectria estremocensis]